MSLVYLNVSIMEMDLLMAHVRKDLTTMRRMTSIQHREWGSKMEEVLKEETAKDLEEEETSLEIEMIIKKGREVKVVGEMIQESSLNQMKNQKTLFIAKSQKTAQDQIKENERIKLIRRTKRARNQELLEPMLMVDTVNRMKLQDSVPRMEIQMTILSSSLILVKKL